MLRIRDDTETLTSKYCVVQIRKEGYVKLEAVLGTGSVSQKRELLLYVLPLT